MTWHSRNERKVKSVSWKYRWGGEQSGETCAALRFYLQCGGSNRGRLFLAGRISIKAIQPLRRARRLFPFQIHSGSIIEGKELCLHPHDSIKRAGEDQSQKLLCPHAFGFKYGYWPLGVSRVTSRDPAYGYADGDLGLKLRLADYSDGQRGSGGVARLDARSVAARDYRDLATGREVIANGVAVTFFSGESIAHDQASRQVGSLVGFEVERRSGMRHRVVEPFVTVMRALKKAVPLRSTNSCSWHFAAVRPRERPGRTGRVRRMSCGWSSTMTIIARRLSGIHRASSGRGVDERAGINQPVTPSDANSIESASVPAPQPISAP